MLSVFSSPPFVPFCLEAFSGVLAIIGKKINTTRPHLIQGFFFFSFFFFFLKIINIFNFPDPSQLTTQSKISLRRKQKTLNSTNFF